MTTKEEMIEIIKAENPTIKVGNDTDGYTELIGADYDVVIEEWATNRLARKDRPIQQNILIGGSN